jgi:hypothetical protein
MREMMEFDKMTEEFILMNPVSKLPSLLSW